MVRPCIFFGSWGPSNVDSIGVLRNAQGLYELRFFGSFPDFTGGGGTDRLEMSILATITDGSADYVATVEQAHRVGGLGRSDQINVIVAVWDVESGAGVDTNFSVLVLKLE